MQRNGTSPEKGDPDIDPKKTTILITETPEIVPLILGDPPQNLTKMLSSRLQ